MTALDTFKKNHMTAADTRWEQAVLDARRLLTYDRARDYGERFASEGSVREDAAVRKLARLFFSVRRQNLWYALGGIETGFGIKMNGYGSQVPYKTCDLMEFLRFFIGHELLDDGTPGVAYRGTHRDNPRPRRLRPLLQEPPGRTALLPPEHRPAAGRGVRPVRGVRDASRRERHRDPGGLGEGVRPTARSMRRDIKRHGEDSIWTEEDAPARSFTRTRRRSPPWPTNSSLWVRFPQ